MADDAGFSDGSDIDVDDGEIGSDFGDSEPGEQQQRRETIHLRRPSNDDDSDSSEFGGFQLSWQEGRTFRNSRPGTRIILCQDHDGQHFHPA